MKVVAVAVLAAVLALGAWGAHQAIGSVKASVATHARNV